MNRDGLCLPYGLACHARSSRAHGDFICVGVLPPADRRTIMQLHAS
jgi:hypothetical protein